MEKPHTCQDKSTCNWKVVSAYMWGYLLVSILIISVEPFPVFWPIRCIVVERPDYLLINLAVNFGLGSLLYWPFIHRVAGGPPLQSLAKSLICQVLYLLSCFMAWCALIFWLLWDTIVLPTIFLGVIPVLSAVIASRFLTKPYRASVFLLWLGYITVALVCSWLKSIVPFDKSPLIR
jgi:hypothetical protein